MVTGGASGIGKATVKMIVENGGKAVIADINPLGYALVNELGKNVLFHQTDVRYQQINLKHLKATRLIEKIIYFR